MMRRSVARFPLALKIAAFGLGSTIEGWSQDAAIEAVDYMEKAGTDPAVVNLEVASAPLSRIRLERSFDLLVQSWEAWTPPVVALDSSTPISVPLVDMPQDGFFRIVVEPPRVAVMRQGGEFVVNVAEDGVSLDEILIGLYRELGTSPFFILPYSPDSEETSPGSQLPSLQKGTYRGIDLLHLGKQLGAPIWEPAPERDDGLLAEQFVPLETNQGEPHEVPGDGGSGKIEDGWNGDDIKELPGRTESPPEPGSFDMRYNTDISGDTQEDQAGNVDLAPGKHVRLRLRFDGNTFTFEKALAQDTGNGLLTKPFPIPAEGWFILLVRNPNGQIYHLMPFEDPRNLRAYQPPQGGSHGHEVAADGSVLLTLPILGDDVNKGLEGIELSVLRMNGSYPGEARLLTPDVIERNPNLFPVVARATGAEIAELLGRRGIRPLAATKNPEVTTLHRSGSNGSKFNVAVMCDGFRDIAADQTLFNDYAADVIMDTLRTRDIHPAVLNGMNIFRVNTFSEDSGITRVNSSGTVTTARSTALEYRFSGDWNRCWMEPGPNSQALIDEVVEDFCPQADFVVLLLNTTSFGGCAGGNRFTVTRGADWSVVAHEFGHRPGTLGDEYTCGGSCGCYGGGEPGAPNLTKNTSRASLKWNVWVPSWRPLPTTMANVASNTQDVGLFPGATIGSGQWTSCIFRPSSVGRMNNNSPVHNPVGYTNVREQFRPYQDADLRRNVVGDFDGDGRTDAVLLDGRQLALYIAGDRNIGADDPVSGSPPRGVTGVLTPTWYNTDYIRNAAQTRSWQVRGTDILLPGDFDADGKDDLFIINLTAWNKPYIGMLKSFGDHFEPVARYDGDLPGWETRPGDQFYVADFNGDGRDDLMVFNGSNWSIPYFGMLRSTGASLQMSRRYDKFLPGWEMGRHEKFSVGDFDNNGRQDVVAFNTQSWGQVHFMLFTSTGPQLALADRYYGTIPGFWQMRRNDRIYVLDFSGDGESDIAIFNGLDWGPVYLGYLRSNLGTLTGARRYDNDTNPLPGWQMQRRDRFYPANVDGDADDDLAVYNKDNWATQYLGILRSTTDPRLGFTAQGSWQDDWINAWNLGSGDEFRVAEFRGTANWEDLFVFNEGWFGLLRGYHTHFRLEAIYRKWIFNQRYHGSGWW